LGPAESGAFQTLTPYARAMDLATELRDLLAIPSICGTPAEAKAQTYLAERWRASGYEVDEWQEPLALDDPQFPGMEVQRETITGVIARRRGSGGGPTLVFNGHTDVVPPGDLSAWHHDPFAPSVIDGPRGPRIVGRGACDMKAGLVAAWVAVEAIGDTPLRGDVILAPVSAEEDGGAGTFHLLRHGLQADLCVIPEPTSLAVIPANAGAVTFRLRIPDLARHASRRTDGVSAIEKLLPIMAALQELETQRNADVDQLMQVWPIAYPLSMGVVHAGDWASTVPDLCIAEGRYGIALDEDVAAAKQRFEQAVAAACTRDPWLRDHPVQVEWWGGQFASGRTPLDHRIVSAMMTAHRTVHQDDPAVVAAPYGSDLRLMTGIGGIATVQYGPGDSKVAHAPNEFVDMAEVEACVEVFTALILDVCA